MKTKLFSSFLLIIALAFICTELNGSCSSCSKKDPTSVDSTKLPLNLSIYIDLSDRIVKERDGLQASKDTAVVGFITRELNNKMWKKNIKLAKDRIKVFFYPAPNSNEINQLSKALEVDFGQFNKKQTEEKMNAAQNLNANFNKALQTIYDNSISEHKFIGSDIWGFFDTKAKDMCVKNGYRNVLVILTDGYIYDEHRNKVEGNQANYITKQTLAKGMSLTTTGKKVEGLEVLVLEVNANPIGDFNKIEATMGEWFKSMGITKYKIAETDLPKNTESIIQNFLNQK